MRAELEAAIIATPDDPAPRAVYADWLMAGGDDRTLGEWMALAARDEAERAAGTRTRGVAVGAARYFVEHRDALLGEPGAALMRAGHLGWRGGLVDELRIHGDRARPPLADAPGALAELLARPIARWVRRIALGGGFLDATRMIEAIAGAELPLLAEVIALDAAQVSDPSACDLGPIAHAYPGLAVLAIRHARCTIPPPNLRTLVISANAPDAWDWLDAGWLTTVETVWIDCLVPRAPGAVAENLARLPNLRDVRAFGAGLATPQLVEGLRAIPRLVHREVAAQPLRARFHADDYTSLAAAPPSLRRLPALGRAIDSLATDVELQQLAFELSPVEPPETVAAVSLFRAYLTTGRRIDAEAFAIRHGTRFDANDRALAAIELARAGDDLAAAEIHAAAVDPRVLERSLDLVAACAIVDLRTGRNAAAIGLVNRHDPDLRGALSRAILALAYLGVGEPERARALLVAPVQLPLQLHGRAALELAEGAADSARATIAELRATYPHDLDRGWLAVDPLLAALREDS